MSINPYWEQARFQLATETAVKEFQVKKSFYTAEMLVERIGEILSRPETLLWQRSLRNSEEAIRERAMLPFCN